MRLLKKIIPTSLIIFFLSSLSVSADIFSSLGSNSACKKYGDCSACDFIRVFLNMEKMALGLLGTLALLAFVYGGIKLVLSQGNSEQISSAQSLLINTVIGSFLVLLAWVIVNFIVLIMTGQTSLDSVGLVFNGDAWYKACLQ